MPDDGITAAQISAAGQVVAQGINYASAASANRKGRKWAEGMYDRQRADALTDRDFQNDYNSPAATMARLKAGGLNPNLVYGDGANSPAVQTRGSDASWKPEAPKVDLTGASNSILAIAGQKNTEAQTDNLKATRELIDQQILKTAAETQATGVSTETSAFNLEQIKQKASTDIAQVKANLNQTYANTAKTEADTAYTLDQNERSAAINSVNIQEALQKIANMKVEKLKIIVDTSKSQQEIATAKQKMSETQQQITNLQTDNRLKLLDEALKKNGIQPHDPAYQRKISELIQLMPTPKRFKAEVDRLLREFNNYMKQPVNR